MSERNPFGQNPSQPSGFGESRKLRCEDWEGLIAEALDGALSAVDFAAFEQHRRECAACSQMLEEVRQGAAWLGFLDGEPEMPPELLAKILARTSGLAAASRPQSPARVVHAPAAFAPVWHRISPVVRRFVEPRLIMTAAMAFFSIALTLNLAGVKISEIRASDLRPSALRTSLGRRYYSAKEQGVKYYENLRFVYEMEARVRELRRSTESEPAQPAPRPPQRQSPSSHNGGGSRQSPDSNVSGSTPRREGKPSSAQRRSSEGTVLVNEVLGSGQKPQLEEQPRDLLPEALLNVRTEDPAPGIRYWNTRAQAERSLA
jgi:hypothetical protein